jgi:hypothetical protein
MLALYEGLLILDYFQTQYILKSDRFYEKNPFINYLGPRWNWSWFGLWCFLGVIAVLTLSMWVAAIFLGIVIICQSYWVVNNFRIGVRLSL